MARHSDQTLGLQLLRDFGFLDLGFCNRPGLISTIRRFVGAFFSRSIPDGRAVEHAALAVHELLEGVAEYSTSSELRLCVEVFQVGSLLGFRIRAQTRVDVDTYARLRAVLEELNQAADPSEAYQVAMRASMERGDGSPMRLARVRAEARMLLSVEGYADGLLTLVASTEVPEGQTR